VKTLLLLRHAKSSWAEPDLADHDRPLARRGQEAARRIAEHLRDMSVRPQLVLCSSARRAVDTLAPSRRVLEEAEVRIEDWLYGASARRVLTQLREIDPRFDCVMVVGHNPTLEDLALELTGDGDEKAMTQLQAKFPTGALATLHLGDSSWSQLRAGRAQLAAMVIPRKLE
jgi:phosphohistidine phosphatase